MDVFTVRVLPQGEALCRDCDGIEFAGRIWLVLEWRVSTDGKWRTPSLAMPQEEWGPVPYMRPGFQRLRFVAKEKLSISVFGRPIPQSAISHYGIVEFPEAKIAIPC